MVQWCVVSAIILGVFVVPTATAEKPPALQLEAVDPLVKVFADSVPHKQQYKRAHVARGECATFQVVVRCEAELEDLRAEMSPLVARKRHASLDARTRFVGYVPVNKPTPKPSKDQLRKPPADFPDPLLEVESVTLATDGVQPIWITANIPLDAPVGLYRGALTVTGRVGGQTVSADVPLSVQVYDVTVGRSRLWVTNWFNLGTKYLDIDPRPYSDEYYALLRRYAENMAAHRQNVALISPLSLAEYSVNGDGELAIDFAQFDRWVTVFQEAGVIGLIEGGHIGGRKGDWNSQFVVATRTVKDGKIEAKRVDPASAEADSFYARFFPALVAHLREKEWLKIYMQHLADEPIASNVDSYRAMAALAREYAPELRIIEACHTKDLAGAMDIWVPQINYAADDYDHYQERQRKGEEVWFYTCIYPQGEFANRFIEQPLIRTRLLHWINYRYGFTGYLHWGYNQWRGEDPFTHTTPDHSGDTYLPAGDAWIVYPGKDGPLDSIRHEAMRDGIADYELLCMLEERDPKAAQALAAKHILEFNRYATSVREFRKTRRKLLKKLD